MRCTALPEYDRRIANRNTLTCSPARRIVTSPKSTSASAPGIWVCGMNAFSGLRPVSIRICGRRTAT